MKMRLLGLENLLRAINRKGSSAVLVTMIMVAFISAVMSSIAVCRSLVVKSESECFANLWHKGILSEYDIYLLEDYGILAFQGSEKEVNKKLAFYSAYSCEGKLDASIGSPDSSLGPYVLADSDNFLKSLKNQFAGEAVECLSSDHRIRRPEEAASENHIIANQVVIDTLPSKGVTANIDVKDIGKRISDENGSGSIAALTGNAAVEAAFIKNHLGSHLYNADSKKTFLINEWEYLIEGKLSDEDNYQGCRKKIFIARNILNLASLYKDSDKMTAIIEISELITPGPAAVVTQTIIAECWAAAEAEEDLKRLTDYGRVPLIKGPGDWVISLHSVINSDKVEEKLSEEARKLLSDNEELIDSKAESLSHVKKEFSEGQSYEDYLLIMIFAMNDKVRLLRIMDIVQINMKCRHYADFNMEEYYIGADIAIEANGRAYEAEGTYR